MASPRKQRTSEEIFTAAVEYYEPQQWEGYLVDACGDDEALRQRVRELLDAHRRSDSFLQRHAEKTDDVIITERPGSKIGPYKLLQEIGEGGFGVVYMAEQLEPVRRKVALKIIKPGMDTRQVIARFEAERQALAIMDHPNIAKVLDAGATKSGRPYFVMELVKGIPITEFCDSNNLSTRDRLELFVIVCRAVQHAHQKGVIHRDLKSTNVMVTLHDNKPMPVIIDFGVSKAISHQLTEKTLFTAYGQMVGTPAYMSPEQAQMSHLDIDTRSDIYSLGVLLYELLTGGTPLDAGRLRDTDYAEMQRLIREEEPPKPSSRLSALGNALPKIAQQRSTDPRRLGQLVRGDLDWIVMKALEKERNRRYGTASGLANDVERFLDDQPVVARPPSFAYLLSKLVGRHRGLVAAAVAVTAAVFLAMIGTTAGMIRAKMESTRACKAEERTADLLYVSDMDVAQTALESSNVSRVLDILQHHRDDPRRGFEWYYLYGRLRRSLLCPTLDHEGAVWGVAFSPDGDYLATGTVTGDLSLWDVRKRKRVHRILCGSRVTFVAYSPDGEQVAASCGDGSLRIWNVASKDVQRLEGHQDKVWRVAFSPDGRLLASADTNGQVLIWNMAAGGSQTLPSPHVSDVWGIAFSADSSQLVSCGTDGQVLLWDLASHQWRAMPDSPGATRSVAISPDGRRVVAGHANGQVSVWDLATDHVATFDIHPASVWSLQFTRDGTRLISGSEGVIRLSSVVTGQVIQSILGHESSIFASSLSIDGLLATASHDGLVKIWDLEESEPPSVLTGHSDPVTSVAIRGQSLASASFDGEVRVWNLRDGAFVTLNSHEGPVWDVKYLPDGRLVSVGADRSIIIWDVAARTPLATEAKAHRGTIRFVVLAPDGSLMATGGDDETVRIWSTKQDIWSNAEESPLLAEFAGHEDDVQCAAFVQRDSQLMLATGSDDRKVLLWDLSTGSHTLIMEHISTVWSLASSRDGQLLVSGGMDGKIQLYHVADGEIEELQKRGLPVHTVFVAPRGDLILAGGLEQSVKIWDAVTGEYRASLRGHTSRVWGLCSAENEPLFASASADATIRLWRAATEREVAQVGW